MRQTGSMLAVLTLALASCGQAQKSTKACGAPLVISGSWNTSWVCIGGNQCQTGTDRIELTQDPSDLSQVSFEIVSGSDPFDVGLEFTGELCDLVLTWSSLPTSVSDEHGTWTFSDAKNFTKKTSYHDGDGVAHDCTGQGTQPPLPLPPPTKCPAP